MSLSINERAQLHGNLETIFDTPASKAGFDTGQLIWEIRDCYRWSRMYHVAELSRRKIGKANGNYPTGAGVILTTADLEKSGPIAIQAVDHQTNLLQWVDQNSGQITSSVRYSLEPWYTDPAFRLNGFFLHEAILRVRFSSDVAVWEQRIEMYRDSRASFGSWTFSCRYPENSVEHLTKELFLAPDTGHDLFLCHECWNEEEDYQKCLERRQRETLCFIPEGA